MSIKNINIYINGESKKIKDELSVLSLLKLLNLNKNNIAVEINREIINKSNYNAYIIKENDRIEIVNFIGGGNNISKDKEFLNIAGKNFTSRLIIGSGKFKNR